jgi:3-oxoacyl-[acyl-carrier protein] reductase
MSRVAVITGASRGIGRAVALEAASRGFIVLCCAQSQAGAGKVANEIERRGRHAAVCSSDLATPEGVDTVVTAADRMGSVSLLVNNAGITTSGLLDDLELDAWDRTLALNLTAPVWLTKLLAPQLAAHHGSVVNIGSTGGIVGSVHSLPYAASKAGLIGATKTLARMLAPAVRVNLVAPGIVDTDLLADITDDQRATILAGQPLNWLGAAEEIARTVLDISSWTYATGQTVVVDGGRVM